MTRFPVRSPSAIKTAVFGADPSPRNSKTTSLLFSPAQNRKGVPKPFQSIRFSSPVGLIEQLLWRIMKTTWNFTLKGGQYEMWPNQETIRIPADSEQQLYRQMLGIHLQDHFDPVVKDLQKSGKATIEVITAGQVSQIPNFPC